MEYTFESHDELGRKNYANFLTKLILSGEKYRRDEDSKSFILAIDSSWGTGKTTFINMWNNELEKNGIIPIIYNAWENDFWDNAFEPFMVNIMESEQFKQLSRNNKIKNIISNMKTLALNLAAHLATKISSHFIGEDTVNTIKKSIKKDDNCKGFKEFRENIYKLKKLLQELVAILNSESKKIVIIVDELDRCKPIFAINTLEIIKHLFNVEKMTFVLSLDVKQLSGAIKCVYGQDIDAKGYLNRFFDYLTKMPFANREKFIRYLLSDIDDAKFIEQFINIANLFNLSLRDIQFLNKSYRVLYNSLLFKYRSNKANILYLSLIAIKFFMNDVFGYELINLDLKTVGIMSQLLDNNDEFRLQYAWGKQLNNLNFSELRNVTIIHNSYRENGDNRSVEIECDDLVYLPVGYQRRTMRTLTEKDKLRYLFIDDFAMWEKIKDLRLREFYSQQLEVFNYIDQDTYL